MTGLPVTISEQQVFALVKTEERNGLELAVFILSEEYRVFTLHFTEFRGENQRLIHAVTEFGPVTLNHFQIDVIDIV
jgi:hypothetical protein